MIERETSAELSSAGGVLDSTFTRLEGENMQCGPTASHEIKVCESSAVPNV